MVSFGVFGSNILFLLSQFLLLLLLLLLLLFLTKDTKIGIFLQYQTKLLNPRRTLPCDIQLF